MTKIFLSALLVTANVFACEGFLPKNDMYLPVNLKGFNGTAMSQETFNEIIDQVEDVYQSEFSSRGLSLTVDRRWTDGTVNASASYGVNKALRTVNMFGGLARHPQITPDAFTLVMCHEVGHHLAGTPIYTGSLLSAEAQSDYFATSKCARKVFMNQNNSVKVKISEVPPVARVMCEKQFSNKQERLVCQRIAVASVALGKVLSTIGAVSAAPKLETPDKLVVARTIESYPSKQCRLDTFFQGSICEKSFNEDFSMSDEVAGACHGKTGQSVGLRPRCWFKPN